MRGRSGVAAGSVFLSISLVFGLPAAADDAKLDQARLSAREVVTGVVSGRFDTCEVASAALARIAKDSHNAFISTPKAGDLAPCRDTRRSGAQSSPGRLAGLPIAVKDNVLVAGQPATFGTSATKSYVPSETASAVQRLIDAGAVVVGKLNLHELAGGVTSNNAVFGPVRNAYDEASIAGGSSGGAGAAVAAGLVPVALGTDTAGSVLIPAALNGVVGFRPSVGRYPMDGVVPVSPTRDTIGPIARSVADIVLVDGVLAQRAGQLPAIALAGIRIGVPRKLFVDVADKASRGLFDATIQRLVRAGIEIVDVELPGLVEAEKGYGPITPYELRQGLPAFLQRYNVGVTLDQLVSGIRSPDLIKDYQNRVFGPAAPSQEAYMTALTSYKPAVEAVFRDAFAAHKLAALAFPTTLTDARPIIGVDETIDMDGVRIATWKAYINNTNFLTKGSLAAITLPTGMSPQGLPLGITLAVLPGRDDSLLSLALEIERLLPELPLPPR
jgi:mandelamide amidase